MADQKLIDLKNSQPNFRYQSQAENRFPMQRLAWPLAISMLLHAILLSQLNWNRSPAPTGDQHRLTVNISFLSSTRPEKTAPKNTLHPAPSDSSMFKEQVAKKIGTAKVSPSSRVLSTLNTAGAKESDGRLDMNHLLNQARDYAKKELRAGKPDFSLDGDYYGTYAGSDSGTFYVHLDNAGHASGSGQSNTFGISFSISGQATKDGLIQMSGTGIAGNARFKGQLDIKTGQISGSWLAASIGSGTFSGHHE